METQFDFVVLEMRKTKQEEHSSDSPFVVAALLLLEMEKEKSK